MDTPRQMHNRAQEQITQKDSVTKGPFITLCTSVNYRTEKLSLITPMQSRQVDYFHPYVSTSSWFRCSPEPGVKPLLAYRSDRFEPVILKYQQENNESRIQSYTDEKSVYRPLRPGEQEASSKGLAQSYWSERPIQENRAGVTRNWLNQDELESGAKAPLHIRQMIQHKSGKIGDEIREGVVKRYTDAVKSFFPKIKGQYAKEILTRIASFGGTPEFLLYKREGEVIDDDGKQELHNTTAQPLRLKNVWYTKQGQEFKTEMDDVGNFEVSFPDAATEGGIVKIPKGNLRMNVEEHFNVQVNKSVRWLIKDNWTAEIGKVATFKVGAAGAAYTMQMDSVQKRFILASPTGHTFAMDDSGGSILLNHRTGALAQISEAGDWFIQSKDGGTVAIEDGEVKMVSKHGGALTVGKSVSIGSSDGGVFTSQEDGAVTHAANKSFTISTPNLNLEGGSVYLGKGAVFNTLNAQMTMAWLGTHTHIGAAPGSPGSPPMIPPMAFAGTPLDMVAMFVFVKGNLPV